jgi:hypothetical protein
MRKRYFPNPEPNSFYSGYTTAHPDAGLLEDYCAWQWGDALLSIVFHGHDHFYAKQDLDGIIYQEVPQPGTPANGSAPRSAAEYGYLDGTILGGPGHLRVGISPQQITVDCLRSAVLPQDGTKVTNRQVVHAYTVPSR